MASFKLIQAVLFFLIFYLVFADVALSPFYPQFFEKVFGISELEFSAFYIFIARLTVVIAVPLWGILSKYYEVKHLVYIGQWISFAMLLGMAGAASVQFFILFTILLLIGKSSFFLIYPLLIELNGKGKRAKIVGMYHIIFHSAIILGTLSGAWIIKLTNPLILFYGLAVVELLLWVISFIVFRKLPLRNKSMVKKSSVSSSKTQFRFLLAIGLVIFGFHIANNMIRPYFVTYIINDFQVSLVESSILFIIPSVMAIIAYPLIRTICLPKKLPIVFISSLFVLAVTLILQGMASRFIILCMARIFYGFFLAIAQAALEIYLFDQSNNQLHMNYTIASSFQNAGLLVAPILASMSIMTYNFPAPLIFAGFVCLVTLVAAHLTIFKKLKTSIQKEDVA